MNEGPAPAVLLEKLTYRYPDGRLALDGISARIASGESVALIGPNGAGKSTLLLHLNGLLPGKAQRGHHHGPQGEHAGEGSVRIDGLDAAGKDAVEVRRRVGLLFQDPDDQLFCASVLEDVAFGPLNLGMKKSEARRVALEALDRVGLRDEADRVPHHLSFGQKKRACLAGVLACGPTILALDEPSANLDPRNRRRLITLIAGLDATKLIATHDLEMALELCPRAVLLDGGKVAADGPIADLLADEALMEAHGLEVPMSLRYAGRG